MTTLLKSRYRVKSGKLQKVHRLSVSKKIGLKAKADRTEKRLRANRERTR